MLVGPPFDVSQLGMVSFRAPDIASGGTWINSKPLTIKALKGKVVAVHFWTFGCSNCIQNYPWYRDWQTTLGKKGLVIVGVHTPETEGERDETSLRETIKREKFQFPVVVDDQRKIWDTWGNGMWPSVYLIDKQGRLRFWWYGELNWNGAGGQEIMAERIEQLLAEAA